MLYNLKNLLFKKKINKLQVKIYYKLKNLLLCLKQYVYVINLGDVFIYLIIILFLFLLLCFECMC